MNLNTVLALAEIFLFDFFTSILKKKNHIYSKKEKKQTSIQVANVF